MFIEIGFKEVGALQNLFPMTDIFRDPAKNVEVYMVKFNIKQTDLKQ